MSTVEIKASPWLTSIDSVPVTKERDVRTDLLEILGNAGSPRAVIAASVELPDGTPGRNITDRTVLQQHVDFFDTDNDGVIRLFDTYHGFRVLGFNIIYSLASMFLIHLGLSYATQPSWIPSPMLNIYVDNIHKAKHGSDSETYDTEGRYIPEKFESIFSKYDRNNKGGLSLWEMFTMIYGNTNSLDPLGLLTMIFEWGTLWLLASKGGVLYKEEVRAQYDGSLFYKIAEEREARFRRRPRDKHERRSRKLE